MVVCQRSVNRRVLFGSTISGAFEALCLRFQVIAGSRSGACISGISFRFRDVFLYHCILKTIAVD